MSVPAHSTTNQADAELPPGAPPQKSAPSASPHSLRLSFGLRGLFVLVGVCGLQFALVARLGGLWGLAVGVVVCLALIGGLLAMAIVGAHRHGTPTMDRLDRLAVQTTVAIAVLVTAFVVSGGGALVYRQLTEWDLERTISADLGFSQSPTWAVRKERGVRVIRITGIEPGGPFAEAGVQVGDVIDAELTPREYFLMLDANRGREVEVTLATGIGLQPLEKCSRRTVKVLVPPEL